MRLFEFTISFRVQQRLARGIYMSTLSVSGCGNMVLEINDIYGDNCVSLAGLCEGQR